MPAVYNKDFEILTNSTIQSGQFIVQLCWNWIINKSHLALITLTVHSGWILGKNYSQSGEALQQAAHGDGGVTVSEAFKKGEDVALEDVVSKHSWSGLMVGLDNSEVFSNLNDSVTTWSPSRQPQGFMLAWFEHIPWKGSSWKGTFLSSPSKHCWYLKEVALASQQCCACRFQWLGPGAWHRCLPT